MAIDVYSFTFPQQGMKYEACEMTPLSGWVKVKIN